MAVTEHRSLALGIDVGGSYTDVALLRAGELLWSAKIRAEGRHIDDVAEAVRKAFGELSASAADIELNALSRVCVCTTFATNALVERNFQPVALFLIGYPRKLFEQARLSSAEMNCPHAVQIQGGHSRTGDEAHPLDETELREKIADISPKVQALAFSGFYSVRNASHEIRAREIARELASDCPVVCGHELTGDLNAVTRATTTALNAALMPASYRLIEGIRHVLAELGAKCPLFVVRSDGTLMTDFEAMDRPIQMLLSGPAASVAGAAHLLSLDGADTGGVPFISVDMGGTTTDIALIEADEMPDSRHETVVGGFRTSVASLPIRTYGLGGDSRVEIDGDILRLSNKKAVPLAYLPKYRSDWEDLLAPEKRPESIPSILCISEKGRSLQRLTGYLANVILREGAVCVDGLTERTGIKTYVDRQIDELMSSGVCDFLTLTPTDALNTIGECRVGCEEVSSHFIKMVEGERENTDSLPRRVKHLVSSHLALHILESLVAGSSFYQDLNAKNKIRDGNEKIDLQPLYERFLRKADDNGFLFSIAIKPLIVGIGAPIESFLPEAAKMIGAKYTVFENGEVAGAIGAAALNRHIRMSILIQYVRGKELYRAYLPDYPKDHHTLELCVDDTKEYMSEYLSRLMNREPAETVIDCVRKDDVTVLHDGSTYFFATSITFSASTQE